MALPGIPNSQLHRRDVCYALEATSDPVIPARTDPAVVHEDEVEQPGDLGWSFGRVAQILKTTGRLG